MYLIIGVYNTKTEPLFGLAKVGIVSVIQVNTIWKLRMLVYLEFRISDAFGWPKVCYTDVTFSIDSSIP